jgi:ferritin
MVLTNGIITCNNQIQIISSIKPSEIFIPLLDITINYINDSSNAYKYYLNYANYHNKSDLDIANQYLNSVNQNSQNYLDTLVNILHDHGYSYTVQNDKVTYSVLKIPF